MSRVSLVSSSGVNIVELWSLQTQLSHHTVSSVGAGALDTISALIGGEQVTWLNAGLWLVDTVSRAAELCCDWSMICMISYWDCNMKLWQQYSPDTSVMIMRLETLICGHRTDDGYWPGSTLHMTHQTDELSRLIKNSVTSVCVACKAGIMTQ